MGMPIELRPGLILALLLLLSPAAGGSEPEAWDADAMRASHRVYPALEGAEPPALPKESFLVVEAGDDHASLLDGERLELIHRWPTRPDLRGTPGFSADGRHVFLTSGAGWITKYDLRRRAPVAEIRAGLRSRDAALSGDGRYLLVANDQPPSLVMLDARDLALREVIEVVDEAGRPSRVSGVYDAPARNSFIVALQDSPELWELRYDAGAPPVYQGFVHDFRLGEGVPVPGEFPPRRVLIEEPLDDLLFDPDYFYVLGVTGSGRVMAIDLDARRRLASLALPGLPRTGAGVRWQWEGRRLLALPNREAGVVSLLDEGSWTVLRSIPVPGPGRFLVSHDRSPYLWGDVAAGPQRDLLYLIDKTSLELAHTLRPAPGRRAVQAVFSADGRRVLVSIGGEEGAVVVYDSRSLEEIGRIPMRRPTGHYRVPSR